MGVQYTTADWFVRSEHQAERNALLLGYSKNRMLNIGSVTRFDHAQ